jgi:PncC family amidohydrolase
VERLEQLVQRLAQAGQSLACAESGTGGLSGARLTAVPGVSAVFRGGVIAYANSVKASLLGVDKRLLETEGAVSAACAAAMAEGVRERLRCDWGVATTGIAGPGGATPSKPVGLVYVAVAGPVETVVDRNCFAGDRHAIREQAVARAFDLLHDQLGR